MVISALVPPCWLGRHETIGIGLLSRTDDNRKESICLASAEYTPPAMVAGRLSGERTAYAQYGIRISRSILGDGVSYDGNLAK